MKITEIAKYVVNKEFVVLISLTDDERKAYLNALSLEELIAGLRAAKRINANNAKMLTAVVAESDFKRPFIQDVLYYLPLERNRRLQERNQFLSEKNHRVSNAERAELRITEVNRNIRAAILGR